MSTSEDGAAHPQDKIDEVITQAPRDRRELHLPLKVQSGTLIC